MLGIFPDRKHGSGSGSSLPTILLTFAAACTLVAVVVSAMSVFMHLKNYRKPVLQRCAPSALIAFRPG